MGDLFVLAISGILINNILLAQFLGNCPFLGTSKKMETAIGMSMAVVFPVRRGRCGTALPKRLSWRIRT